MADKKDQDVAVTPTRGVDAAEKTMQRLFEVADVEKAYGKPVKQGEVTIIPAGETVAVAGFGAGFGVGDDENGERPGGGGGGGGGRTWSRPVAVVVVSPEGVRVEPVIDLTKIALAALTAGGFMLSTLVRMRRGKDGSEA